ncbi:F-box family protein [Raphanus sativus]|nr:F-box family protein [Raphanus sativus]
MKSQESLSSTLDQRRLSLLQHPKSPISRKHIYHESTLINYKGKLGGVDYHCIENSMTLWVLEDAEKQEWSSIRCDLPSRWKDLLGFYVRSKGVSHTGELMVFYPWLNPSEPFYVCYYDFNKKSTRKVEIRGMADGDFRRIHGIGELTDMKISYFTSHIENFRFL